MVASPDITQKSCKSSLFQLQKHPQVSTLKNTSPKLFSSAFRG